MLNSALLISIIWGVHRVVKKILCLALAGLLVNMMAASAAYASSDEGKQARFVEQVKKGIATLGTGPDARVELKLHDKTKLKGYLKEVAAEYFVVTDLETGATTKVLYPEVKQVRGQNLSKGSRIAVGLVVSAAVFIVLLMLIGRAAAGS
jgi:hypothetical protein